MRWPSVVLSGIGIAVIAIAGWQIWETKQLGIPKWVETDRPDCQVWNPNPQRNETASWSGDCVAGKVEGEGTVTWRYTDPAGNPLTETHSGGFSAGKFHGHGTAISADGYRFDGMYRDGEKNGHGVAVWADARYEGEWKDGKPNGFGTYTSTDGEQRAGEWVQGCLDDDGEIFWIDSDDETCEKLLAK
jgi:hypothetical protein